MTLREALAPLMKVMADIRAGLVSLSDSSDREHVLVIARGDLKPTDGSHSTTEMRFYIVQPYGAVWARAETRGWLGEQWSNWRDLGTINYNEAFDLTDVFAEDWRWLP